MIVSPNAKINLGLFVTEKRPDGYHNLESVFYPVDLADTLEVLPVSGTYGECRLTNTGIDVGCPDGENLIAKAYRLLATSFRLPSVEVCLHKNIPSGAGLGGGSADAAFMLSALNNCFELGLQEEELLTYALRLGSDCGFFIKNRPAFVSGRGEQMEDIDIDLSDYELVLVKPALGVSTAEAYAGITPRKAPFDLRKLSSLPVCEWKNVVYNDFERTICLKYPELQEIKEQLYRSGALYASMSGSGSTIFGLFEKGCSTLTGLNNEEVLWQEKKGER